MDIITAIFLLGFAAVVGRLLYGRIKHGSWTGAMLEGRVERAAGEISVSSGWGGSQTLRVHTVRAGDAGESSVALVLVKQASLGASMQPLHLTKQQALDLARLLTTAAR